MRNLALRGSFESLNVAPPSAGAPISVVLMETGHPEGGATLVVTSDGSASLYLRGGGGVLRGGHHEVVEKAAKKMIDVAARQVMSFAEARETPTPRPGRAVFYVRTGIGILTAEAAEEDLAKGRVPLSPVFLAGHAVITLLRQLSE
jgi:hypothetical protein